MRDVSAAVLLALVAWTTPGIAQTDSATAKRQAIRELVEMTGATQMGEQTAARIFAELKPAFPTVPAAQWEELAAEIRSDEYIERIVPIYERHLTLDEAQSLVTFYSTPAGQKLLRLLPMLAEESMAVHQQWGHERTVHILETLRAKGYRESL